jgi:hypothetical protein
MSSDPKLPFDSAPTGVETRSEVSSEATDRNAAGTEGVSVSRPRRYSTARLWLRRVGVLLFVFLCATLGVMLMIVPWRPEWADNPLLVPYPALRDWVGSGFTRGVVMGLGLVNVWIGFWEALRYREE